MWHRYTILDSDCVFCPFCGGECAKVVEDGDVFTCRHCFRESKVTFSKSKYTTCGVTDVGISPPPGVHVSDVIEYTRSNKIFPISEAR
jgi:hypothetical protein